MSAVREVEEVRPPGALRITITLLAHGIVHAAVVGPFRYAQAMELAQRIDLLARAMPSAVILDLRSALPLFGPVRALSLCDRVTGIAALGAPAALVTGWCSPKYVAWFELECAKRGLTRRVFADVPRARRWATETAQLLRA